MLVITLPINYLMQTYVLSAGALSWLSPEFADVDLSFLSLIMFIAVIASMTQLVEMVVEKYSPSLYASLGIFLPLIAVNCAILGGSLFMQQRDFPSVWTAVCAGGAGASAGFSPSQPSLPSANASHSTATSPARSAASALHSSSPHSWA